MKYFSLLIGLLLCTQVAFSQSVYPQNATIQLDENGQAIITPTDVLVNLNGQLRCYTIFDSYRVFEYNHTSQTLIETNDTDVFCGIGVCEDVNPINGRSYLSADVIDVGSYFTTTDLSGNCNEEDAIYLSFDSVCGVFPSLPRIFTFDNEGILYTFGIGGLVSYDVNSNITTQLNIDYNVPIGNDNSNFTYDFDNDRIVTTRRLSDTVEVYATDLVTGTTELLFVISEQVMCRTSTIEYIGDNTIIANSLHNGEDPCYQFYSINLLTEVVTPLNPDDFQIVTTSTFVENEIENVSLSTTNFTCDDLGENVVDITYVENGETFTYQSTVTIVSDFAVVNCPIFVNITETPNDDTTDALMPDFTTEVEIASSCSTNFTITQEPAPGTLIPYGEAAQVLITVTDEFDNEIYCSIATCSRSFLSNEEFGLESAINLYPNPTENSINIENKDALKLTLIQIQDVNGRILKEITPSTAQNTTSISLNEYASGIYFIKIIAGTNNLVKQVIKL